jgi:Fur family ferric uptake transcriptional regulator
MIGSSVDVGFASRSVNCFTTSLLEVPAQDASIPAKATVTRRLIAAIQPAATAFPTPKFRPWRGRRLAYTGVMESEVLERLDAFIRKKGLRRTGQRDTIVRAAFASDEHFTAEELFDRVRKTDSTASRATVYRTLALLVEANLLREIELGDNHKTYDPNFVEKPAHNHLVCIDCGRVMEFEDSHIELINDCVTRRLGFRPVRQSLKIEAGCEQLRLKGRCPNLIAARLSGKRLRRKR